MRQQAGAATFDFVSRAERHGWAQPREGGVIPTGETLASRLEEVRQDRDLSLREFARRLREDAGYEVSYSSVRDYERGESSPPAPYLEAVSRTFDVDPLWLLKGEDNGTWRSGLELASVAGREMESLVSWIRSKIPSSEYAELIKKGWKDFVANSATDHPVRDMVLRSWKRSREAGVDPDEQSPHRALSDSEVAQLRSENADLVADVDLHLDWLELLFQETRYVLALIDPEGRILLSRASTKEMRESAKAFPGYDWSEESMGTSGPGLALKERRPVVLIGPEHYPRDLHDVTCIGCPILDASEELRGVLSAAMPVRLTEPMHLAVTCYSSWMIERSLSP